MHLPRRDNHKLQCQAIFSFSRRPDVSEKVTKIPTFTILPLLIRLPDFTHRLRWWFHENSVLWWTSKGPETVFCLFSEHSLIFDDWIGQNEDLALIETFISRSARNSQCVVNDVIAKTLITDFLAFGSTLLAWLVSKGVNLVYVHKRLVLKSIVDLFQNLRSKRLSGNNHQQISTCLNLLHGKLCLGSSCAFPVLFIYTSILSYLPLLHQQGIIKP